ncbi:UNVERIFIED_CONTAM: hypothetical protein LK11_14070 [Mumia flava]|nr:methyltransferase domain-containing protein [Mumia flava]
MATEQFMIDAEQAEAYEERFVPALFRQWVEPVLEAAEVGPGDQVLDVACGTGVVARAAVTLAAPGGSVTGVDLNPAMLAVAHRVEPRVSWEQGDVAALPFPAGGFDVLTCQAAIFFFPDPAGALAEMRRVTRPGGRVVVHAFSSLHAQPAYGPWVEMVTHHAGPEATELLGTYWSQGDPSALADCCADVGLRVLAVRRHTRPAFFPSVEAMVRTEVNATPLRDRLDVPTLDRMLVESHELLETFVEDGRLVIPIAGYTLSATP